MTQDERSCGECEFHRFIIKEISECLIDGHDTAYYEACEIDDKEFDVYEKNINRRK